MQPAAFNTLLRPPRPPSRRKQPRPLSHPHALASRAAGSCAERPPAGVAALPRAALQEPARRRRASGGRLLRRRRRRCRAVIQEGAPRVGGRLRRVRQRGQKGPGPARRGQEGPGQRAHPRARSLGADERAPVLACLPLQIPPPCPIRPPCPHQALRGEPTRVLRARRRCEPEPRGVAARSARRAGLAAASAPPALPPPRVVVSLHSGWG